MKAAKWSLTPFVKALSVSGKIILFVNRWEHQLNSRFARKKSFDFTKKSLPHDSWQEEIKIMEKKKRKGRIYAFNEVAFRLMGNFQRGRVV